MATENNQTELQKSDLDLAKKTHQVLVPQNVYIGDSAELRVSFSSENALMIATPAIKLSRRSEEMFVSLLERLKP